MTAPLEPIERIRQALAAGPQVGETSTANAEFSAACSPDAIRSLLFRLDELEKDAGRLREAMTKIDAIRNSIIGRQSIGWSAHVYPLVAALDEAGFPGLSYEDARAAELRAAIAKGA